MRKMLAKWRKILARMLESDIKTKKNIKMVKKCVTFCRFVRLISSVACTEESNSGLLVYSIEDEKVENN